MVSQRSFRIVDKNIQRRLSIVQLMEHRASIIDKPNVSQKRTFHDAIGTIWWSLGAQFRGSIV